MKKVTATEFARNFKRFLDDAQLKGEEIVIVRNNQEVARLLPGPAHQTALEAMADLYRTLPDEAAAGWPAEGRLEGTLAELRDPWAT